VVRGSGRGHNEDFALELMEPRVLLSADLSFTTSTNHDVTVRVDASSAVQIVDTNNNNVLAAQPIGTTAAVRITGSSSADHVTVDLSNPFAVPVFFNDASDPDDDELSVVGSDVVSWTLSGADEGSVAAGGGITFTGVENLSGDAGNRDTFVIGDTALLVGTIDGGAGGFDSVVMKSPTAVTLTNAQINLGALQFDIAGFESAVFEAPSLNAAAFSGQTLLTTGLAQWTSQGPGALNAGQVRLPPDNFVAGAVQDVAIHPFDLSSMYVGTVGGGVWKNSDISVLFEFEEFEITDLTAAATARLLAFADFLKANPSLNVKVVGHTDDLGDQETVNQPLSVNRANTVKQFLVNQGIDASRLVASGRGELEPVDTNGTLAGREHNRRVELIVNHWVPLTDQFPTLSISALVISPRDADGALVTASTPTSKLVLYAGTGSTSSGSALFNNLGATTAIGS
jgi:outer membrane protein OmpA-like peptidoglycan-associated protein